MASTICSRTRTTGFSEFIAPWATSAIAARRRRRICSSGSSSRLTPSSCTRPPSILPGGRISRMSASAIVDLPEPDSPTRQSRSSASSPKLTTSTAFTGPRGVWYQTRRSSTRKTSAATGANSSPPRAGQARAQLTLTGSRGTANACAVGASEPGGPARATATAAQRVHVPRYTRGRQDVEGIDQCREQAQADADPTAAATQWADRQPGADQRQRQRQYPRACERHAKEESGQDRHRGRVQIYE